MILVKKLNDVFIRVKTTRAIELELSDAFRFRPAKFWFDPRYKQKRWDGYVKLYNLKTNSMYLGLLPKLLRFAKDRDYPIDIDASLDTSPVVTIDQVSKEIKGWGLPFVPHDYQIAAICDVINKERLIIESATGSGKSFIIYALSKILNEKTLVIVPTLNLVSQMFGDFEEYSKNDDSFNTHEMCQELHGETSKVVNKQIVFGTWQTVHKLPKEFFEQFSIVVGDEAHGFAAKSLTQLMEKTTNVQYKIGMSGSIQEDKVNRMVLEGLFGDVKVYSKSRELINRDILSNIDIRCIVLNYSDKRKNDFKKKLRKQKGEVKTKKIKKTEKFKKEIDFIADCQKRNNFIAKLSLSMKSNSLILFQRISHGKELFEIIKELNKDSNRKIYYVDGKTPKDERESIRNRVESETNSIIVASLKTFSTGINIKNLYNLIIASPFKSPLTLIQTIGRVLRKGKLNLATVFDIADNITGKNYARKHFIERLKIYSQEKHKYRIKEIEI